VIRSGVALGLLLLATACGPKLVPKTVFESDGMQVRLRHQTRGGEPLPRGYDHPVAISGVRVAHILASLVYLDPDERRQPLIRSSYVYTLADGISKALKEATPDDEVVAIARTRERRLTVFTVDKVTSFRLFVRDGQLQLEVYALDEGLDREERQDGYKPPVGEPRGRTIRFVPDTAQATAGPRAIAVDWRDPYYRKPKSLRARRGRLSRRTVLMEDELVEELPPTSVPASLTDAQMQALDQLDAARRSGLVSEAEFQRRRRLVLQGRLDEAGYGSDTP
jgi:hypothetical protein